MLGEQLVEDHAQRVDIGVNADALAGNLFGRGIGGRHQAQARARLICRLREALEVLRDPEVEQLHRAGVRHENVRGLDVAVNHRVSVSVLDGGADRGEQLEAAVQRGTARAAVLGDRDAVYELEREPRRAVGERVGVVQLRDGGMHELRERSLLGEEALAPRGREPRVPQHLDRCDAA